MYALYRMHIDDCNRVLAFLGKFDLEGAQKQMKTFIDRDFASYADDYDTDDIAVEINYYSALVSVNDDLDGDQYFIFDQDGNDTNAPQMFAGLL